MEQGTVKWFDADKGYGFIIPDEGRDDLFVHHTDIRMDGYRSLSEGARVKFNRTAGRKGQKATDVAPIGGG